MHRIAGAPLDFLALRAELAVPGDFASAVVADAAAAVAAQRRPVGDETSLPLVTLDPVGSRDLDQAVHICRDGSGFVVHYALADVASFVRPGSPTDVEAHARGETNYLPDGSAPMLPPLLSQDAASLLPQQLRPAVLWRIALDDRADVRSVEVARARVRSTAQLDYPTMQAALDANALPEPIALLPEVGRLRQQRARERHAIDLDLPDQEVVQDGTAWRIELRAPTPIEQYNAEISLLTGMCAARLMLDHRYGILRTVPPPSRDAVHDLRQTARALGIDWPDGVAPGDVLAGLDRTEPRVVALLDHAASLLRGAAYTAFGGAVPDQPLHSGIAAPYAHVTAPMRRLVDRYANEICLAHAAGVAVPDWVRAAVPSLPAEMARADQHAHAVDRAVVDATEAWLLTDRVGERFDALVIDAAEHAATVLVDEPPVRARCQGENLSVGEHISVTLVEADVVTRTVRFAVSGEQLAGEDGHRVPAQRDP